MNEQEQAQRQFIVNISQRLGRPMPKTPPEHPFRGAPPFWKEHTRAIAADPARMIAQFIECWQQAGGEAKSFPSLDGLRTFIVDTAAEMKARAFIRHRHPLLDELKLEEELSESDWTVWDGQRPEEMKNKANAADIGVIVADYAVSATGTIVTMSSADKGRSVSLLPPMLIAIVPASCIRSSLGEVMSQISAIGMERMPAGIHFISGPSRSADIENDLTIGVHGPGIVYALIFEDR